MSRKLRLAYFAHSVRSDWNNGNAHFLRGLLRAMGELGHAVTVFEPKRGWSIDNLQAEERGGESLAGFAKMYGDLEICAYGGDTSSEQWMEWLRDTDAVLLHEWNEPDLARLLLGLRDEVGYKLVFHDTHHRASSTPEQIERFGIAKFDGVVVFGEALRTIYRERFAMEKVWTLHEAADASVFYPRAGLERGADVVWIGNWGDGERSKEIDQYLLQPAKALPDASFLIYGVRYPDEGIAALRAAGVGYGGYLPNLDAPAVYAAARLTLHIPRQQYVSAMAGIPTIRVFEALASGIPLISAPWDDAEGLFRAGDYVKVGSAGEMTEAIKMLLGNPAAAAEQARQGRETVLARHTCRHRAEELTGICEDLLA